MVFKEIVEIIRQMMPQLISWPVNHQQAINVFRERSHGFPGVVGAIDGCHIPIKQPKNNATDYYNRKEFHSIILQGVCDHRMAFIDVFIGMPGRVHDARVFRSSDIYQKLINANNPLLSRDMHLLGDSAYPLMTNLLTPYRDNGHLNDIQNNYNYRMNSIRSVIERTFGRLKGKFRRLKYLDIGDPDFGTHIISAACVLHNFLILNEVEEDPQEVLEEDLPLPNPEGDVADEGGNDKRDNIANMLL
ncbi:putative nuclease HARBI1 [Coccinella septempunctata]|nr:putative nuclease HARBI1 [Coccinella septempunctata]